MAKQIGRKGLGSPNTYRIWQEDPEDPNRMDLPPDDDYHGATVGGGGALRAGLRSPPRIRASSTGGIFP
jgi:hypothetical protein